MYNYDKDLEKILREHEGWVLSHARICKVLEDYQKIKDEKEKIMNNKNCKFSIIDNEGLFECELKIEDCIGCESFEESEI